MTEVAVAGTPALAQNAIIHVIDFADDAIARNDATRKAERYTRAVSALKVLLAWWASLGDVEQASKASITRLILTAEGIIADEKIAWTSTGSKAPAGKEEGDEAARSSHAERAVGAARGAGGHNNRVAPAAE